MFERERRRQVQLTRRYEIQKNIPRQTSSSQGGTLVNRMKILNEDVNLNSRLINGYNGSPLRRHDSQGRLKNLPITAPLNPAQSKRHSIANIHASSTSNHSSPSSSVVNTYNDSTVFETTVPGRRNYVFEQIQHQQIQQKNTTLQKNRFRSYDNINSRSKSSGNITNNTSDNTLDYSSSLNRFYNKSQNQAQNDSQIQRLFKNSYLQDPRTSYNLQRDSVFSKHTNKTSNPSASRLSYMVNDSFQDGTSVSQNQSTENSDDTDGSDNSSDETQPSITDNSVIVNPLGLIDGISAEVSVDDNNDGSLGDYETLSSTTRTQWKQLLMRNEIDSDLYHTETENKAVGGAWLNQDNYNADLNASHSYGNEPVQSSKSEQYQQRQPKPTCRKPGMWTQSSLEHRNMYERVTNDLRNMVLFSHNPLVSSLKRTRNTETPNAIHAASQPHITLPVAVGARVELLWEKACAEFCL